MSLPEKIKEALKNADPIGEDEKLSFALLEAERLADLYAEIRPIPYIVPLERYAGIVSRAKDSCEQ